MNQNDTSTEIMIQAAGLTAPRVTSGHIDALMARLAFATHVFPGTTSTVAIAQLDGFVVGIGHSACVSLANFNAEIGAKIAIENATVIAREKLWELEGYSLKRELTNLVKDFSAGEMQPAAAPMSEAQPTDVAAATPVPEVQITDAPTLAAAPEPAPPAPVEIPTVAEVDSVADVEHQPV